MNSRGADGAPKAVLTACGWPKTARSSRSHPSKCSTGNDSLSSSFSSDDTSRTEPRLSESTQTVFCYDMDSKATSAQSCKVRKFLTPRRPGLCFVLVGIFFAVVLIILSGAFVLWYFRESEARSRLEGGCHTALDKFSDTSNKVLNPLVANLARKDAILLKSSIQNFLETPRVTVEMLEQAMEDTQGLVTTRGLNNNAKFLWTLQRFNAAPWEQGRAPELENIYYGDHKGMYMAYTNLCVQPASERCGLDWRYGFDLRLRDDFNVSDFSCGSMIPPLEGLRPDQVYFYVVKDKSGRGSVPFGNVTYDPRSRPWYKRAVKAMGMTTWSNIYEDRLHEDGSHPDLGFTVSRAHYRDGKVLMVAGSTVTLAKLTELLVQHNPWKGEGEHLFIVDTSGFMVASSRGRPTVLCGVPSCKHIQALWNQTHSREIHEAMGYLMNKSGGQLDQIEELGIHETKAGHIFSWVPLRSGPKRFGLSWIAIFVQPVANYKGNVSMVLEERKADIGDLNTVLETDMAHARLWTIGGCLLIMVVGALSVAFIAWQVTRPLKLIAQDMNAVAKLELDKVDDLLQDAAEKGASSMIHEVAQIRDSFNDMTSGLRSFSRYMDPYVVQVLLQSQRQAQLGVARADVTIFFSDIADFTTITENVPPPVFLDMLGEYLDRMSGIIMKHHGVVGEFIGDGIMAWWNVPCDLGTRHTKAALHAALEQQQVLSELRPAWCQRGLPEVWARMGLVRGQVYAGNIGSKNRMKYGLVGDKVNLASRLESLCKRYSVQTLVDSEAHNAPDVAQEFFLRLIDVVVVKGRTETTELFELVAHKASVMGTSLQAMYERFCGDFEQIHAHYRQREFQQALDMLQAYLVLWPGDRPAQIMKQRCEALLEVPPSEDWSHVQKLCDK